MSLDYYPPPFLSEALSLMSKHQVVECGNMGHPMFLLTAVPIHITSWLNTVGSCCSFLVSKHSYEALLCICRLRIVGHRWCIGAIYVKADIQMLRSYKSLFFTNQLTLPFFTSSGRCCFAWPPAAGSPAVERQNLGNWIVMLSRCTPGTMP